MMSLTVEESTTERISPLLNHIVTNVLAQNKSSDNLQKDLMFTVIIVLMTETKFLLVRDDLETIVPVESIDWTQISKWKSQSGLFEAPFVLHGFRNIILKIIMSPLGSLAIVNAVIKDLENETYTVCLPISRYVVSPQASSIPMIFRDLKHFSEIFKNKIISPVKSKILNHYGYASASLAGLPEELIWKIMLYLPISNILDVAKTCSRLSDVLKSEDLWHDMCKRDYSNMSENTNGKDWKIIYMEQYISMNERKDLRSAGTMHDYMDYSDYVSYIDNPMWDVIL